MTDAEMEVILDLVDDIFIDQISAGHHPITIASVVFAVAIKHLKTNLDKEEFSAGDYTIEMFTEGYKLGETKLTLR